MNLLANGIIDATTFIILIMLYCNGRNDRHCDYSQTVFDRILICLISYLCIDFVAWIIDGMVFPASYGIQLALNTAIYVVQIVYAFLWLLYADFWIFRSMDRIKKRMKIYVIPMLVNFGILAVNLFTGCIFEIGADGFYTRGYFYLPSMIIFYSYDIYALFLSLSAFRRARDRQRRIYCLWLSGFMVMPVSAALILTLFVYGLSLTAPFFALSMLMIYLNVHQRRLEEEKLKVAQRDGEIQRANVAIMLSQIQPHFLYNSLTAIYELCDTDPQKARSAVAQFSSYLRFNMNTLSQKSPIPFKTELNHVENYLKLEKLRFEEKLNIEYDIQADGFMIPSLTVQPLVENAVKHGVGKKASGGTVKVATRETDDGYEVIVSDDGVGFDASAQKDDGKSHIGIENVRSRLESLSGAELRVESEIGKGTVFTILISKCEPMGEILL